MTDRETVLVADDDEAVAQLLQTILEERAAVTVVAVHSGRDALQKAWELRPALILLDLALPDIDGLEVATHLKSNPTTSHIPVLVVSALPVARKRALCVGCEDTLEKPFDVDELVAKVRRHLEARLDSRPIYPAAA